MQVVTIKLNLLHLYLSSFENIYEATNPKIKVIILIIPIRLNAKPGYIAGSAPIINPIIA